MPQAPQTAPMVTTLVTGASRGIGRAIVTELAERGHAVLLAARGEDELATCAEELRSAGHRADWVRLDVADRSTIGPAAERARAFAAEQGGPLALCNNAGIAISAPLLKEDGLAERHLEVNFHGPRLLCEALVPGMLSDGGGAVLNIASSAGLQGYAYVSAYCASKHALVGYTRAAALELGPKGVAFGAICPHYVDSPMLQVSIKNVIDKTGMSPEDARGFFAQQNPSGELVTPGEVARAAADWFARPVNGALVELGAD